MGFFMHQMCAMVDIESVICLVRMELFGLEEFLLQIELRIIVIIFSVIGNNSLFREGGCKYRCLEE